jgi:hypothetical protein
MKIKSARRKIYAIHDTEKEIDMPNDTETNKGIALCDAGDAIGG